MLSPTPVTWDTYTQPVSAGTNTRRLSTAFAEKRQSTEKNATSEDSLADSTAAASCQYMGTMNNTTTTAKVPGMGILTTTFRALDGAVKASMAMVEASRRANEAFDAYFPGVGMTTDETAKARVAYADASDASDAARTRFNEATHALCVALDSAPTRYQGRFVRNQWVCVGELVAALQSSEDEDLRRAVTFLRFRAA